MAKRTTKAADPTQSTGQPLYTYECVDCNARTEAAHHPPMCEDCGGEMQNISITRDQ